MGCEGQRKSARNRNAPSRFIDSDVEEEGDGHGSEEVASEDSDDRDFVDDAEVEEGDLHRNLQAQLNIQDDVQLQLDMAPAGTAPDKTVLMNAGRKKKASKQAKKGKAGDPTW